LERANPIKKSNDLFKATIRECLSREVLTDERVWHFSKRAREYICAYHVLHEQMIQYKSDDETSAMPEKIEALAKHF
jgi:hypothetical protein